MFNKLCKFTLIIFTLCLVSQACIAAGADEEYRTGELYRLGNGVEKSAKKAQSHYMIAAEKGHPLAQLSLGKLYYFGELGPNKKEQAFYWISKAAHQDNADAQWMLGGMLFNGDGTQRDVVAAYSWLTLASEQNHAQAQLNLQLIEQELSPKQLLEADRVTLAFKQQRLLKTSRQAQEQQAYFWLHKAAEKGDANAQFMVAEMLYKGKGIDIDLVAAYAWSTLASDQGKDKAVFLQEQIKKELKAKQLKEANVLIESLKKQIQSNQTAEFQLAKTVTNKPTTKLQQVEKHITKPVELKSPKPDSIMASPRVVQAEQSKKAQATATVKPVMVKPKAQVTGKPVAKQKKDKEVTVYRVQLGAFKTEQAAQMRLDDVVKLVPKVVEDYGSTITKPKLNSAKPDYYRLQLGAFRVRNDASILCERLKEHKQSCFVVSAKVVLASR